MEDDGLAWYWRVMVDELALAPLSIPLSKLAIPTNGFDDAVLVVSNDRVRVCPLSAVVEDPNRRRRDSIVTVLSLSMDLTDEEGVSAIDEEVGVS